MAADVRKPPMHAVLALHPQGVRGTCGWCGGPVKDKTPGRGWLKWWHDDCAAEMAVIENPSAARDAVLARDKGVCCDCGEDWSQMFRLQPSYGGSGRTLKIAGTAADGSIILERAVHVEYIWQRDDDRLAQRLNTEPHPGSRLSKVSRPAYAWVRLTAISLWHVDHKIPLWKVRHMPDLARLEYFKLHNLITRCHRCHAFKTAEEAAERAKFKRQGTSAPVKAKSKWASRPMQSRNNFPPKGSTKFPTRRK